MAENTFNSLFANARQQINGLGFLSARDSAAAENPSGETPEKGLFDEMAGDAAAWSLSPSQRLSGFVMLFVFGVVCLGIAMALVPTLLVVPKKFAFFVTMGNFFLVASTAILIGVKRQIKSMSESHRIHAAFVFVFSMLMTLVAAVYWKSYVLSVAFTVLQVSSFAWYTLSYIPFARHFMAACWGIVARIVGPIVSIGGTLLAKGCARCAYCLCNRAMS